MKPSILLACEAAKIDLPLRRSLAHLVKSCEISIVHNGHDFFDELESRAFNLMVIDFEIPGVDGLELVESVQYIDPGVPVILLLKKAHQSIWDTARRLKAHPMIYPFKPLKFLRLVDKLLHQHLNHYRQLAANLITILENLNSQTVASGSLLLDGQGQILMSRGEPTGMSFSSLTRLVIDQMAQTESGSSLDRVEAESQKNRQEDGSGLYVVKVIDNLYLGLIDSGFQTAAEIWERVDTAAREVKAALDSQLAATDPSFSPDNNNILLQRLFISLPLGDEPVRLPSSAQSEEEADETAVNWEIISNTSSLLKRLDDFCQVG